jgi:hypothetical protein
MQTAQLSIEVLSHFLCHECGGWWSVSDWICQEIVCCPHCGEPLEVPAHDAETQRFLDEVERMKDVPAPCVPIPDLEWAREIAIEKWGRKCGN